MNSEASSIERKPNGIEIEHNNKVGVVLFHDLNLTADRPYSPEVEITVEKRPIEVKEGESYCANAVLIDAESKEMQAAAARAHGLLSVPESQRPGKLLEILRSEINYAYDDAVEQLIKSEPERASWVADNVGLSSQAINVPLSEIFRNGYGVCRHLAVAYLWLAQKAGMKGVLQSCPDGVIKNIVRSDNHKKLFRIEDPVAHVWAELQASDGKWIPVDPSTKLVGDSAEGLEMFRRANYLGYANPSLDMAAEPNDQLFGKPGDRLLRFKPGEALASGTFCLELKSAKPIFKIGPAGSEEIPPENIPYSGDGKLTVQGFMEKICGLGLDIKGIKEQ